MRLLLAASLFLAAPVNALEFRRSEFGGGSHEDAADSFGGEARGNPLLAVYRKRTQQYEKDARDALGSAAFYTQEAKRVANEVNSQDMSLIVKKRLKDMGVSDWAYASWAVQGMLNDRKPVNAADAAAKAAAPYNEAYGAYDKAKTQYDSAAMGYALRAKQDAGLAQQLMSYSNQFRLQGDTKTADNYNAQSSALMAQADKFKGLANTYSETAAKIYGVLPSIQGWAGKAGAYAAYQENPLGALPAKDVFPFTVVPPAA